MDGWALFSSAVVAVPLIAAGVWILSEQISNRQRRKFLRRYEQCSVSGIRKRVERELATEDMHVMPKIQRGPLVPDPLQDGKFSGRLPSSKRPRRYARQCNGGLRRKRSEPSR
jgi:hypothetical protein